MSQASNTCPSNSEDICKGANDGNVTKDRLGPCQGSNERKVKGAGMGSGCGVQRRRRRLAVVCLPIRVQCRFGLKH